MELKDKKIGFTLTGSFCTFQKVIPKMKEIKKLGADKVIAINFKADDIDETSNFMDISMRILDIMGNKISEESLQNSDFILTIQTDKTGLLDINQIDSCYKYGYKSALKNLSKIKSILKS